MEFQEFDTTGNENLDQVLFKIHEMLEDLYTRIDTLENA